MYTIEKHMDLLAEQDIQQLLGQFAGPCISIYIPTQRQGAEIQQNPIRLKNAITEVREQLTRLNTQQIDELLAPLQAILDDPAQDILNFTSDGLAIFIAPEFFRVYRLPQTFDEFVFVGDHFHIRQLLPLIDKDERFYILALSQGYTHLYQGNRYQIEAVDLADVPQSLSEAMQYDQFEKQLQLHTTSGDSQGIFHGQGGAEANQKDNILQWFRALDKGVSDFLNTENAPLILAGVDHLRGLYRQANHYAHLREADIETDPQKIDTKDLHTRAWAIIQPDLAQGVSDDLDRYHQLAGNNGEKVTTDLEQIISAAYYQRIDTLFLTPQEKYWGSFDPETSTLETHADYQAGDHDLLNDAAIHTIINGGTIHTVENVPGEQLFAAILRY